MNSLQQYLEEQHNKAMIAFMKKDFPHFIRNMLPGMLTKEEYPNWNTLDVLYHEPRVQRLFRDVEIDGHSATSTDQASYNCCLHDIH